MPILVVPVVTGKVPVIKPWTEYNDVVVEFIVFVETSKIGKPTPLPGVESYIKPLILILHVFAGVDDLAYKLIWIGPGLISWRFCIGPVKNDVINCVELAPTVLKVVFEDTSTVVLNDL